MKSFLAAAFISIFLLASCDNNNHPDIDTSLPATTNAVVPAAAKDNSESPLLPVEDGNQKQQQVQEAPAEVYQAAGLNPPHGQPGHDCAIAVGAPLNGKPSSNGFPAAAPAINFPTATQAPSALPVTGGQRLNPPHGQPGHDCAIAVGAPLG